MFRGAVFFRTRCISCSWYKKFFYLLCGILMLIIYAMILQIPETCSRVLLILLPLNEWFWWLPFRDAPDFSCGSDRSSRFWPIRLQPKFWPDLVWFRHWCSRPTCWLPYLTLPAGWMAAWAGTQCWGHTWAQYGTPTDHKVSKTS